MEEGGLEVSQTAILLHICARNLSTSVTCGVQLMSKCPLCADANAFYMVSITADMLITMTRKWNENIKKGVFSPTAPLFHVYLCS